ncbi:hypothetical protein AAP_04170 [Ascosphaera apis ARSEF 7405]|uniref:Uncharacterized protein n=1 Tax=Ascosphaera apis ARSEF 7405 TaxID=392613 RepID=A0A167X9Z8_9EURO|nr:hypothetical protein AAP_04170 [Ascosphaera apis ARSEF 7405]
MFAAKRSIAPVRNCMRQAQRRSASHAHGEHHHAEPVNVNLKPSFFFAIAAVPLGISYYSWANSNPNSKPVITRLIEKFSANEEALAQKNHIHTLAAEKAAFDKHLFAGCKSDMNLELSTPDLMNTGSPMNVPAGHEADLSEVISFYNNRNKKMEEARRSRMQDGKVQSIYDHAF